MPNPQRFLGESLRPCLQRLERELYLLQCQTGLRRPPHGLDGFDLCAAATLQTAEERRAYTTEWKRWRSLHAAKLPARLQQLAVDSAEFGDAVRFVPTKHLGPGERQVRELLIRMEAQIQEGYELLRQFTQELPGGRYTDE